MKYVDLIKARRSVRTFDKLPIDSEITDQLLYFAENCDNPFGKEIKWKILDGDEFGLSAPVIVGSDIYIAGKMKMESRAEEAFGYSFEKVVLYAKELGIGTTWIAGTMNRPAFEIAMNVGEDEVMPCVSPLGKCAAKMSFRESMMRSAIKADSRLPFEELFFENSFGEHLKEATLEKIKLPLEMVRLAPSAVNRQPWRVVVIGNKAHFYEKKSKGFVDRDGWDIQKIDMGIALCHFDLVATEMGLKTSIIDDNPFINTPEDTVYCATIVFD